jgi:hypothetical protein
LSCRCSIHMSGALPLRGVLFIDARLLCNTLISGGGRFLVGLASTPPSLIVGRLSCNIWGAKTFSKLIKNPAGNL